MKRVLLWPTAWLLLAACENTNSVSLRLTRVDGSEGDLSGFQCREAGGPPLIQRGVTQERGRFTLEGAVVIDLIALEGLPHCRVTDLVNWCFDHACAPLREERVCIPLGPVEVGLGSSEDETLPSVSDAIAGAVAGSTITADAPDENVLVRIVATAERCADLTLDFDTDQLLGCAHSCPLNGDRTSGDVQLQLDAFSSFCVEEVEACAARRFGLEPVEE